MSGYHTYQEVKLLASFTSPDPFKDPAFCISPNSAFTIGQYGNNICDINLTNPDQYYQQ